MEPLQQLTPGKARGKFNEKMLKSNLFVGEEKLDGERFLLHCGIGKNRFTSRHISVKNNLFVEKTENVPHLRDLFTSNGMDIEFEGTVLDGEIVVGDQSQSTRVSKIMGALPEKAIRLQNENIWVDYRVFDILYFKGQDLRDRSYEERRSVLVDNFSAAESKHFSIVPAITEDKEEYFNTIVANGGEGIILKNTKSPYAKDWIKIKKEATHDCVIMGFEDPTKITKKSSGEESTSRLYDNGWIGAIKFGQFYDEKLIEFGTCSGMDDALREEISNNKERYLGKVIEIKANDRFPTGRFRHPRFLRFRSDKNAIDCVYNPNES
ncbi:MAG: hypothetical protein M0R80_03840 [Proteobacteria bacterium]|jgi:ATP-dependent DNA ligase|nr:hypothetical protein [Pseudomonadota bacterium]